MTGPANHDYEPPSKKFHRSQFFSRVLPGRSDSTGERRLVWHSTLLLILGCRHRDLISGLDQERGPGPLQGPRPFWCGAAVSPHARPPS